MMATYSNLPGTLNFAIRQSDEFATEVDFSTSLSGFTVSSSIVSAVTGETVTAISTTLTDAAAGKVGLSLTESQTAGLPVGTYGWRLIWVAPGNSQRTALSGSLEVQR